MRKPTNPAQEAAFVLTHFMAEQAKTIDRLSAAIGELIAAGSDGTIFDWRRAVGEARGLLAADSPRTAVKAPRQKAAQPAAATQRRHWMRDPKNKAKRARALIAMRKGRAAVEAAKQPAKRVHWTQRPENRAKIAAAVKASWAKRRATRAEKKAEATKKEAAA